MSQTSQADVAERLRRRYPPPRAPRWLVSTIVGVVAAIGLGWLIWAATVHATPEVAAQISAFTVTSDTEIAVTVTVDRRDPSIPVTCMVSAQAEDFAEVGRISLEVGSRPERLVDVTTVIKTFRRATSAKVNGCQVS